MLIPEKITQRYGQIYPNAWKRAAMFRQNKGQSGFVDWADWCFLPLAASYISAVLTSIFIITEILTRAQNVRQVKLLPPHIRRAHFHTYRTGKGRKEMEMACAHPGECP